MVVAAMAMPTSRVVASKYGPKMKKYILMVLTPSCSTTFQSSGDKIVGNPIGWLQEMCMQRRWPPPSYETETEVGLPHERLFTIACTILNYREVGKGKSKKVAKRLAAHKMWTRLQETPIDAAKINDSICSELEGDVSKLSLVDAVQQPAKTNNSPTPSRYYERVSPELNTIDI